MLHGGEIYDKNITHDLSVSLNPYPVPETVRKALTEAVEKADRYPDITQSAFRKSVAEAENKVSGVIISPDNIIGANGASELIFAIVQSLKPKNVLLVEPGFLGYRHALNFLDDVNIREYYLKEEEDFALTEDFLGYIDDETELVIIANPNNPTGRCIEEELLEKIIKKSAAAGTALMIDESFLYLSEAIPCTVKYVERQAGLFIVSSYTKLFSIPGVRVGYAIANSSDINRLKRFLPEWNMSLPAQLAGEACAKVMISTDYIMASRELIRVKRRKLKEIFTDKGCKVYPSDTCFILVCSSEDLYKAYLDKNILIRDCGNFRGLGKGYYRIGMSKADPLL